MNESDLITLLALPGIGRRTARRQLDSPACLDKPEDLPGKGYEFSASQIEGAREKAKRTLDYCLEKGVKILTSGNGMPNPLKSIPDPPVILYVRGNYKLLSKANCIAVVGSRQATGCGLKNAERLARILAGRNITVVSGLAHGVDTAAHKSCIEAGGFTTAVLPSGFNCIYPWDNAALAENIIASGGCLVSEYPPEQYPAAYQFVERDRLQSGLSSGVIVVETAEDGGAMHTAEFCLDQGRLLGCISHKECYARGKNYSGNAVLLSEKGAIPLDSRDKLERFLQECEKNLSYL